jgi:hypothetical protein
MVSSFKHLRSREYSACNAMAERHTRACARSAVVLHSHTHPQRDSAAHVRSVFR